MSVTSEEIIAVAGREIGYHEGKGKHNKYGEWYGMDGVAWCMEFVQWVYHKAGMDLPYKTASCGDLLNWYKRNQPDCIGKEPIPGTIVIFDFPGTPYSTDHTGLFVKIDGCYLVTIDGNTTNENAGSDANGGWVQQRRRKLSYANPIYITPRGLMLVDWDKAISEMTEEQGYKIYCLAYKHMQKLPLPVNWNSQEQLEKAKRDGITSGDNPMCPTTRLEAAVMADRAYEKAVRKK